MRTPEWLVVASLAVAPLAGCAKAGETPSAPLVPLDQPAAPDPVTPPPAEVPLPTGEVPALVPGAPASAPTGTPVQVTFRAPKVGSVRMRTQRGVQLYNDDFDHEGKHVSRRQTTRQVFKLREEVRAVDAGKVTTVRASVIDGREVVTLDGTDHPMTLLQGTYIVDVGGGLQLHGRMSATHESGREVGSREEEELGELYALDAGNEQGLVALVRTRPLRVGESVVLDDDAKRTLVGEVIPEPIALTLVELVGGIATYQLDLQAQQTQGDTRSVRAGRQRMQIEVATGRVVAMTLDMSESDTSPGSTSERRTHATATFESTSW